MLEIKPAGYDEISIIRKLSSESGLDIGKIEEYITNCMIAYDNKIPVAAAGFININNIGIIKFVTVSKNRRREYLGDGIVKAILNLADRKGVRKVFVNTKDQDAFFRKIGFKDISLMEVKKYYENMDGLSLSDEKVLEVTLPDYFLKACKSNK